MAITKRATSYGPVSRTLTDSYSGWVSKHIRAYGISHSNIFFDFMYASGFGDIFISYECSSDEGVTWFEGVNSNGQISEFCRKTVTADDKFCIPIDLIGVNSIRFRARTDGVGGDLDILLAPYIVDTGGPNRPSVNLEKI